VRIGCSLFLARRVILTVAMVVLPSLLGSTTSGPAAAATCAPPTADEALAIGRAYIEAFNQGDQQALGQLLASNYRHEGAIVVEQDRARHLERLAAVRTAFPDGVFTVEWMIADQDMVAIRHRFTGTQLGPYNDVPASGKRVAVGAFHVHQIACGQIVQTWNAGDGLGLLRQIGALAGPATTPADQEPAASVTASTAACATTRPADNIAAARRWYDDVLNEGRFEVLDELLADDVVHHAALFVDLKGTEQTAGSLRAIRAGFPDIHYTVEGIVAEGDKVLIRWHGRGTQTGAFLGVAPSNAPVDWSGMNAFRFACGKIVEGWSEANGLTIMRQIGAFP
jgi:steroid delta-isomerase-like uncharacterized protein